MSDLVKIREWTDAEGLEPEGGWDWPPPDECIESRIEGDLRRRILAKIGRTEPDPCVLRLIERDCVGGYSEFTAETWWDMEIWLDEGRQPQRIWESPEAWDQQNGLKALLEWTNATPPATNTPDRRGSEGES